MLNIGFILLHPFSESLGTISATLGSAKQLIKRGVHIYILNPFEKEHIIEPGLYCLNIPVNYLSTKTYNLIKRLIRTPRIYTIFESARERSGMISYNSKTLSRSVINTLNEKKIELDIIQSEGRYSFKACKKIGEKLEIPSVVRVHNLGSEEFADLGIIKRGSPIFKKMVHRTREDFIEADGIITLTEYARDFLIKEYDIEACKISHIPIGATAAPNITTKLDWPKIIAYSGSFERHENIGLFVRSLHYVRGKDDWRVFFSGKGSESKWYKRMCNYLGIDAEFTWFDDHDDYMDFLSGCYAGVIPWANVPSRRIGFPMKLLDYLSVGLPVISTRIGGWSDIIDKEKVGLLARDTPKELGKAIETLIGSPEMANEFRKRTKGLIEKRFNWEKISDETLRLYEKLC